MKRLLIMAVLAGLTAFVQPFEQVSAQGRPLRADLDGPIFGSQEVRMDLFGTWATRDRRRAADDHAGLGVGVDYFFTRNVGLMADTYMERVTWPTHLDLSVVGRIPFDSLRFAPYAFAGAGRQWHDRAQWTAHLGGGGEFRMSRQTGIFIDGRRVFADRGRDFSLYRLGFRFGF